MVILDRFWYFCTVGNRNEYSTKQIETVSLQPYYISRLTSKVKNNTKTAERLLQCVLLKW